MCDLIYRQFKFQLKEAIKPNLSRHAFVYHSCVVSAGQYSFPFGAVPRVGSVKKNANFKFGVRRDSPRIHLVIIWQERERDDDVTEEITTCDRKTSQRYK